MGGGASGDEVRPLKGIAQLPEASEARLPQTRTSKKTVFYILASEFLLSDGENVARARAIAPQAAKVAPSSVPSAVLDVPQSATQLSFREWAAETDEEEDSSAYVFAVTSLGDLGPQG